MSTEFTEGHLHVTNAQAGYGDVVAVWDATMTAEPGSVTALLGRNGAGKTSLLNAIAGSLPLRSGSVALNGRDLTGTPAWKRARAGISLVQEGKRIFAGLRVEENLALGLPRVGAAERKRILNEIYTELPKLADMRAREAGLLSGGQQQLLAIGQAIVSQPKVLLVDEPSSGLSPIAFEQVLELIVSFSKRGLAVVLVDQLVETILDGVADRVVILDRGRVTYSGDASKVSSARIASDFLAAKTSELI